MDVIADSDALGLERPLEHRPASPGRGGDRHNLSVIGLEEQSRARVDTSGGQLDNDALDALAFSEVKPSSGPNVWGDW
jgi:hypothetical protein